MAYRYESSQTFESMVNGSAKQLKTAEKKSMQEITKAIWDLGVKADSYAQASSLWSAKAFAAVMKAKQVFSK
ncbi:hypothetical protein B9G69_004455 [Bdellovibrio sp. SKB1291214]|uniref:hypothetical protein n=1 Tax=Bdellovibrio sp. SKB1291214 TaxID=1732569 RepID=UPI000B51D5A3|nr:hypothetical protein [Bdellovibrio sp. SKB1291214]UYL09826.1 hypothetical protein B9G69_004455 [Bdellovibrio sp. SKB1291214]